MTRHSPRPATDPTAAPMLSSTAAPHPGRRAHPAAWYATTFEDFHETDSVGRPRRRKGHASGLLLPTIRHPANLHLRHTSLLRQGRHATGPAGQGGDGL